MYHNEFKFYQCLTNIKFDLVYKHIYQIQLIAQISGVAFLIRNVHLERL